MQPDGLLSTLKHLRLHGMSQALQELVEQGSPACRDALPLMDALLKAEVAEREVRSIQYQLKAARFPHYRDLSTFDFKDIEENGFDPADFDDLFQAMKMGEAISLLAMCLVFLQYPVLELVVSEEEEGPATDFMMGLLIVYRAIYHNEDEDTAVAWIGSEAFQAAYNEASVILQQKNARAAGRTN